jgi:hypothetical protein
MTDFAQESVKTQKGILVIWTAGNTQRKYLKFQYNPETISISHSIGDTSALVNINWLPNCFASSMLTRDVSFSIIFENILNKLDIENQLKWFEAYQRKYFYLFLGKQKFTGGLMSLSWNYKSFWPNLDPQYVEMQLRLSAIIDLSKTNITTPPATAGTVVNQITPTAVTTNVNGSGLILSGPQT